MDTCVSATSYHKRHNYENSIRIYVWKKKIFYQYTFLGTTAVTHLTHKKLIFGIVSFKRDVKIKEWENLWPTFVGRIICQIEFITTLISSKTNVYN